MNTMLTPTQFTVDGDFPGGNIVIDRIDGDAVYLHQDLRDTDVWWFYWHFQVRGAEGRILTFHFTQGDVIGSQGPAASTDGGATWEWLGTGAARDSSFDYSFSPDQDIVHFAFAPAYLETHLGRFLAQWSGHPALRADTLCHTRKGRAVERLWLSGPSGAPQHRVLITCRHHACESIASYVLEGIMTAVLASPADWDHVAFMVVPFIDKDGVEDGDQGKQRRPRDHNRDYDGTSLYATTAALRESVPAWSSGKLRVALDLHCPYIRGDTAEVIYAVGGPDARNWAEIQRFSTLLEQETHAGPLPYHAVDNMPFGVGWNTAENMVQGQTFADWAASLPGVRMATTIETPYATVRRVPVTADAARALGQDMAHALHQYLEELA